MELNWKEFRLIKIHLCCKLDIADLTLIPHFVGEGPPHFGGEGPPHFLFWGKIRIFNKLKKVAVGVGRGRRGAMIPAQMTSKPPELQNYLQALKNWSPSLCLIPPHSGLRLLFLFFF